MHDVNLSLERAGRTSLVTTRELITLRDYMAVGCRHRRIMGWVFAGIVLAVVAATWLTPPRYDARMKILVKRERIDQVVSPDQSTQVVAPDLSEAALNSEVELLKSRDLLEQVAVETGLASRFGESLPRRLLASLGWRRSRRGAQDPSVLRAAQALEKAITVEPLKRANLIQISYGSPDPQLSVSVLQALVRHYLEKHLAVHRLPGALDFFQKQTREYRDDMTAAERRLVQFSSDSGVVAAPLEKDMALHKLSDFETQLQQTRASIGETEQRIKILEQQAATTPARLTTQMKVADNPVLMQQMKSTLLGLELKRTELLGKFTADYRPVQELDAQIAQAKSALAEAERNPVKEETTDRDATHEWITGELAKARTELKALQARVVSTVEAVDRYRERTKTLNEQESIQQDLVRSAKTAEEHFLLYSRKEEEARISDALDQQRIVNVSIAEDATVPASSSWPNWPLNLLAGVVLAGLLSVGSVAVVDGLDRSFRTPGEVEAYLDIPVLASLPRYSDPVV